MRMRWKTIPRFPAAVMAALFIFFFFPILPAWSDNGDEEESTIIIPQAVIEASKKIVVYEISTPYRNFGRILYGLGLAFYISDHVVMTAGHNSSDFPVILESPQTRFAVFAPENPQVKVMLSKPVVDWPREILVFTAPRLKPPLKISRQEPKAGERMYIFVPPKYDPEDKDRVSVAPVEFIGYHRDNELIPWIGTDIKAFMILLSRDVGLVKKGFSGGPIVNSAGEVAGIVIIADPQMPLFAGVPYEYLMEFYKEHPEFFR